MIHDRMSLCVAVALLAACSGNGAASNAEANATGNDAAEITNAAGPTANEVTATSAAAPGGTLSRDFMIGKWSAMGEDCSDVIEFKADGTAETPIGPGKWTLDGDKLSFDYGEAEKMKPSTIKVLTHDRIEITRASGGTETERRC